MEDNIPLFVIIGSTDNINKVINKLPNKNKLNCYHLLGVDNPLIEFGFFLDKEDEENNMGNFNIITYPNENSNFNLDEIKKLNLKNVTAFIICHEKSDDLINTNNLLTKEIIHIWFGNNTNENHYNENHYNENHYNRNDWIEKIYNYIDIPYLPPSNFMCNII